MSVAPPPQASYARAEGEGRRRLGMPALGVLTFGYGFVFLVVGRSELFREQLSTTRSPPGACDQS